ncbi:hypothetical protein VTP01DRAFT_4370 [Rhizomucor pusillus]|uniref:uncharacterized protein n=1 Tax=Rhizomucor pusillus TaxID=4840 RepID=UPI0037436DC8
MSSAPSSMSSSSVAVCSGHRTSFLGQSMIPLVCLRISVLRTGVVTRSFVKFEPSKRALWILLSLPRHTTFRSRFRKMKNKRKKHSDDAASSCLGTRIQLNSKNG